MLTPQALASYARPLLALVATFLVVALALAFLGLVRARRDHADSAAERETLDALTALAATLARAAALTIMADPGPMDAALAERIAVQVVMDLRTLGSETVMRIRTLQGLTRDTVEPLLAAIAREQVAKLREVTGSAHQVGRYLADQLNAAHRADGSFGFGLPSFGASASVRPEGLPPSAVSHVPAAPAPPARPGG